MSNPKNVNHIMKSVVALVKIEETGDLNSFCTAFFIQENRLATACHCITTSHRVELIPGVSEEINDVPAIGTQFQYVNYSQFLLSQKHIEIHPYKAKVIGFNIDNDIAILELMPNSPRSQHILRISNEMPILGEQIYVLGHPGSLFWILTDGVISQIIHNRDGSIDIINGSAQIWFGNSGGPLINNKGFAIGVVSAIAHRQSHLAIFKPIRHITRLLNALEAHH